MNKSQRIYFETGNTSTTNHIKVQLEQDVDTIEFLSMSVSTKDVYRDFNADYGVLVGRVIANGGVGISNAKISVFIPLTDEDAENTEISSYYPYKTPRDENSDGKRYNLLPRVARPDPKTGIISPKQPFGSFPIKEELLINKPYLDVYKKYYKYTALTNIAGDYMIFGVPIGTQTVHLSVDITDIGEFSMNPAAMVVNLGYSANLFMNNGTRIKPSTSLGDLPNVETQEISVDIIPFWGDTENFEIGITRQDFRIRAVLTNTFTIFGSAFTDSDQTMRGTEDSSSPNVKEIRDYFWVYPQDNWHGLALATKRIGKIKETIYYYPPEITDAEIDSADPVSDMEVLSPNEYSVYTRNGDFAFIINCNRDRVVTNEFGSKIPVPYDSPNGVFTTFRGFVTLEYELDELPIVATSGIEEKNDGTVKEKDRILPLRIKFKFPQHAGSAQSFDYSDGATAEAWRKQHMKFEAQKFYSFSRFHACVANNEGTDNQQFGLKTGLFLKGDTINNAIVNGQYNIGPIHCKDFAGYTNSKYQLVANADIGGQAPRFGANWLNLSVYFPQSGYGLNPIANVREVRTADYLHTQWENQRSRNAFFVFDNSMPIAGGINNTKWFGRSDLHWTDIIEVPLSDIVLMRNYNKKGFTSTNVTGLSGEYRNGSYVPPNTQWKGTWSGACPYSGGKVGGVPSGAVDGEYYFYKGFDTSDCIQFLFELGLITL